MIHGEKADRTNDRTTERQNDRIHKEPEKKFLKSNGIHRSLCKSWASYITNFQCKILQKITEIEKRGPGRIPV